MPMREIKTILIAGVKGDVAFARKYVSEAAQFNWENFVNFETLQSGKVAREELDSRIEENTDVVIEICSQKHFDVLIYLNAPILDENLLESEILDYRKKKIVESKSLKSFKRQLGDILKQCGLHWLVHAKNEYEKSSLQSCTVERWVEQFSRLGQKDVAKNLLKSLKVIEDSDLRRAFRIPSGDSVGYRVKHAYIEDTDPGSSSIKIKNVLEHMHVEPILALDLQKPLDFSDIQADVLFVYEDGLWSGVELVKRLRAISDMAGFKDCSTQLHFIYAATTDVGLVAARIFSVRENLSKFQFFPGENGLHFVFLRESAKDSVHKLVGQHDELVRAELDKLIEPYAFRSEACWGGQSEAAISICKKIGMQLVVPFLDRQTQRKSIAKEAPAVDEDANKEKVINWSLGAWGYASTIMFSSSIPKPVLPLFWLQGKVQLEDQSVDWQPLFWDARRTGETDSFVQ